MARILLNMLSCLCFNKKKKFCQLLRFKKLVCETTYYIQYTIWL